MIDFLSYLLYNNKREFMERKDKREVVDSIVWDYLISDNSEIHDRIEAMFIAHLISRLVEDDDIIVDDIRGYIGESLQAVSHRCTDRWKDVERLASLIHSAIIISEQDEVDDDEAVANICEDVAGGPAADDVAVAVAVYCVLRHYDDFDSAFTVAMSYSTRLNALAAILVFNIMGAARGVKALPPQSREMVESEPMIQEFMEYVCQIDI